MLRQCAHMEAFPCGSVFTGFYLGGSTAEALGDSGSAAGRA